MNVVLPELDGRLFTRAVSFKAGRPIDSRLEHASVTHEPLQDRIAFVAKLAAAFARLARKPRAERRLAIVLSDYLARGGRTGYACGLDTPQSLREILSLLARYATGGADWPAADIIAKLAGLLPSDEIAAPLADYRRWLAALPPDSADGIAATWGIPESDPAFSGGYFPLSVSACRECSFAIAARPRLAGLSRHELPAAPRLRCALRPSA